MCLNVFRGKLFKYSIAALLTAVASLTASTAYYKLSYDKAVRELRVEQEALVEAHRALQQCIEVSRVQIESLSLLCKESSRVDSVVKDLTSSVDEAFREDVVLPPTSSQPIISGGDVVEESNVVNISSTLPDSVDRLLTESYERIYLHKDSE